MGDFVQMTDAQLQTMDISSLQEYAGQVSTVIGYEFSTVTAVQKIQTQYDYLILSSQSTMNGLGYEITANSNMIIAADVRAKQLVRSNQQLDYTISLYNSTISGQAAIMMDADSKIATLQDETDAITSTLTQSDINFVSSAIYYSSLYTTFIGKDILYQTCLSNIDATSSILSTAIMTEKMSYDNWQVSSAYTVAKSAELSTLYLTSNAIQSTLTKYKIDETLAIANLNSTNSGIVAVSSLYATSLVNQQYYQTLSTQGGVVDLYTAAYSTFMAASALSNASPTNSVVVAAATMAQQRLSTLTVSKKEVAAQATALQALVTGAISDTYAATLQAAQDAVQFEITNIATFQEYTNSSIAAVGYFSSLYEQAGRDVVSSLAVVAKFSTLYESSVTGSNALMALAKQDQDSIAKQQADIDAISFAISSLNDQYQVYASSYTGWMGYSTLMSQEVAKGLADLTTYSTMYESTNSAILGFNIVLQQVNSSISGNNTMITTQSTILQAETINMLGYQNLVAASFNMEEKATFDFRETYVRQKRQTVQEYYDSCVLQQVQATSTQNGTLKEQAAGASFIPTPINLNTATINNAYTILTNISAFLDTFTTIYSNYATQTGNLLNVSTSIGTQRDGLTAVTAAANAFAIDPNAGPAFSNAQSDFASKVAMTAQLQSYVDLTQAQINAAKTSFLATYQQTFLSNEIIANESTISSFLVQGFSS